jgi:dTDP-4-dehydrorhamnose reductase
MKLLNDCFGAPTWSYRLALQIRELLNRDGRGSYHATSYGYCSPFELAQYVLKKLKLNAPIEPCSYKDLSIGHLLPVNCVLENRLSKKQGVNVMADWEKDLETFLEQFGEQLIEEAAQ